MKYVVSCLLIIGGCASGFGWGGLMAVCLGIGLIYETC